MMGQRQDRNAGMAGSYLPRRVETGVQFGRRVSLKQWHLDVKSDDVRRVSVDQPEEFLLGSGLSDHLEAVLIKALDQQASHQAVLRDDHAHGNSARTVVPAPHGLSSVSVP